LNALVCSFGTAAAASEASYANWKTAREEILASASHPSLSVQTAISQSIWHCDPLV
jgi:hypothetical protein